MEKRLKNGYTTGTCAAAAVAAAVHYLCAKEEKEVVRITLPIQEKRYIDVHIVTKGENEACFAVIKDSGDDPDVTHGCVVQAHVQLLDGEGPICFYAGSGVGRVTLEGLKIPVGEAAINPIPRQMIEKEFRSVYPTRAAAITISIPNGETLAKRTMNARLGVVGGLSILGTTGVVRPMSAQALIDTIQAEMNVRMAQKKEMVMTFGAMGEEALIRLGYLPNQMVQISNYVGQALDYAAELNIDHLVLAGHVGKMIKVAGGIFQTHSKWADARMEILCAHAALLGVDNERIRRMFSCVTIVAADQILKESPLREQVWQQIANAASQKIAQRWDIRAKAIFLDAQGEICAVSDEEES